MTTEEKCRLSSEAFTKAIRSKTGKLADRVALASKVLSGEVTVYLPEKDSVVLEWLVGLISSEKSARELPEAWALLLQTWPHVSDVTRSRLLQSYRVAAIFILAYGENAPFKSVSESFITITSTNRIFFVSDRQAAQLVSVFLDRLVEHRINAENVADQVAKAIYVQVQARKSLFSGSVGLLPVLMSAELPSEILEFYTTSYLTTAPDDELRTVPGWAATRLFTMVLRVGVRVAERYDILVSAFPVYAAALTSALKKVRLTQDVVQRTIENLLRNRHPGWTDAFSALAKLSADAVMMNMDAILELLSSPGELLCPAELSTEGELRSSGRLPIPEKSNPTPLARVMLELSAAASATRQVPEFLAKMTTAIRDVESPVFREIRPIIASSLRELSDSKLNALLTSSKSGAKILLLDSLSFQSLQSEQVRLYLSAQFITADDSLKLHIMSLLGDIPDTAGPDLWRGVSVQTFEGIALLLRAKELNPNFPLNSYVNESTSWSTFEHKDLVALVRRYHKVIDLLETPVLLEFVEHLHRFDQLFSVVDIFETNALSHALIDRYLLVLQTSTNEVRNLQSLPASVLRGPSRDLILGVAWKAGDTEAIQAVLKVGNYATIYETDPEYFLVLSKKLRGDDTRVSELLAIAQMLSSGPEYRRSAAGQVDVNKPYHWPLAVFVVDKDSAKINELFEAVKNRLEDVTWQVLALRVLEGLLNTSSPRVSGEMLNAISAVALKHAGNNGISRLAFSVLCKAKENPLAIAAYYVYTGEQFTESFKAYCSMLNGDLSKSLQRETLLGRHYGTLKVLIDAQGKGALDAREFTLLVIEARSHLSSFTELQIISFLNLASESIVDSSWRVSQFALEVLLDVIFATTKPDFGVRIDTPGNLYAALSKLFSRIMLYQRHRLAGRLHLLIRVFSGLLKGLASRPMGQFIDENKRKVLPTWSGSADSAMSNDFKRLMQNFVNPPQGSVRGGAGKNGLTSSVAATRRQVAKHAPVLIGNYVFLALQYGFNNDVSQDIQQTMFELLGTMGSDDIRSMTASFDGPSRAYFRLLYDIFKTAGRWTKE